MISLLASLTLTCCVIAASAITTSSVPQAIVVEVGETLRIRCPNPGSANASWYKNDVEFRSSEPRIRVLRESVKFRRVELEDTGIYGCKTVNSGVAEWTNVSVTVLQRDEPFGNRDNLGNHRTKRENSACLNDSNCDLSEDSTLPCFRRPKPGDKKVNLGDKLTLDCTSQGDEHGSWYKDGQQLDETGELFKIATVKLDHKGIYICERNNSGGDCIRQTFNVTVRGTEPIGTPPKLPKIVTTVPPIPSPNSTDKSKTVTPPPENPNRRRRFSWPAGTILIGVAISVFLLGVLAIAAVVILRRRKHGKVKKSWDTESLPVAAETQLTNWSKKITVQTVTNPQYIEGNLCMPTVKIETVAAEDDYCGNPLEYILTVDGLWELRREYLTLGKILGEGAFGKVVRAKCESPDPNIPRVVAVKMLKDCHTDDDMVDLVKEKEIMKIIGRHDNIINLLGVCTQGGPLWVVVEFTEHGNLRDFLRGRRSSLGYEAAIGQDIGVETLTQRDLVSFATQVAKGMEYLASRQCIHRDLAARNVLVSDEYVLKIADFGLARDIHCHDYYRKTTNGRLPVKWMAPEALFHRVYTTQSDVWSYGILLWEIVTLGGTPYPYFSSGEQLFDQLRRGYRMDRPPSCPIGMYSLMQNCWSQLPTKRPTFDKVVIELDKILANEEYLDVILDEMESTPSIEDSTLQAAVADDEIDDQIPISDSRSCEESQTTKKNSRGYWPH